MARLVGLVGAAALAAGAFLVPLPAQVLAARAPVDVSDVLTLPEAETPAGGIGVPVYDPLATTAVNIARAWLGNGLALAPAQARAAQPEQATRLGVRAGAGLSGARDDRHDPPFAVHLDHPAVQHPDAELSLALAAWAGTSGVPHRWALAVGTVEADTRVRLSGSVRGLGRRAVEAGHDLLLVPPGHGRQMREDAGPGVEVVEVSSLAEAVAVLHEEGQE